MEIAEIFARWSRFEDGGHAEDWARLFTPDGRCTNSAGRVTVGQAALCRAAGARRARPEARGSVHWMGPPMIDLDPEGADAKHYGMVIHRTGDGYIIRNLSERLYRLIEQDGRWVIADRTIRHLHGSTQTGARNVPGGDTE